MTRISIKGIIISVAAMFALDTLGGIIMLPFFAGDQLKEGLTPEQINEAVQAIAMSTPFLTSNIIFGTITTIFGAYLAARIAKTYPYFNAAAFGVVGLLMAIFTTSEAPFWFCAIAYISTLPAAIFGGHLAKKWLSQKKNT